jgi:hypothetical protein
MLPCYVLTSAQYHWALQPFAYLWNVFWSALQPVIVVTDVFPKEFVLPANFEVRSVSRGRILPKERWSDGLIEALTHCPTERVVLMLDDYWLIRTVDDRAIPSLSEYMSFHPDILRCDLTDDRQFNGEAFDLEPYGHFDLVETPASSPYQMSLQAAIWNRDHLLSVLRPGLSPWEVELQISLADRPDLRVIGTRQCPVRYANVARGGKERLLNLERIPEAHRTIMAERGWL